MGKNTKLRPDEIQRISFEKDNRSYFHMMLNMADDDLDPYQYRLLGHYVRWGGQGGTCDEGIRETARITQMGKDKVRSTRKQLETLGYLRVVEPTIEEQQRGIPTRVIVLDRWAENIKRYAEKSVPNPAQGYAESGTPPVPNPAHLTGEGCTQSSTGGVPNPAPTNNSIEDSLKTTGKTSSATSADTAETGAKQVAAMIEVWVKANSIVVPKTPRIGKNGKPVTTGNPYANQSYRNIALTLLENGITVENLQDFLDEKKGEAYWDGKTIDWPYIQRNIGAWIEMFEIVAPVDDDDDEPVPTQQYTPVTQEYTDAINALEEAFRL